MQILLPCLLRRQVHTQEFLQDPGLTFVSRRRSLHSDSVSTLSNTALWVPFIRWESIVTAIPSKGKAPVEKQAQTGTSRLWTRIPQTPPPAWIRKWRDTLHSLRRQDSSPEEPTPRRPLTCFRGTRAPAGEAGLQHVLQEPAETWDLLGEQQGAGES